MNEPFQYYPMNQDEFKVFLGLCLDRMSDYVREQAEFYEENFPGLEPVPWRQQLAFFRQQGINYWQQLAAVNPAMAAAAIRRYMSLHRREQREQTEALMP